MATPTADLAEQTFRDLLAAAIAWGRRPSHTTVLGPTCWVAIDVVAREHPDATPEQIVAACDAFAVEHPGPERADELPHADPATTKAAEYAAIDALTAQLRITYPTVDPQTLSAIVRRIHADFHSHAVRDFIPLVVEHAAHERLA